ncbi:MAG: hypothetical protein ACQESE_00600 [Nanobdellota archaeon]
MKIMNSINNFFSTKFNIYLVLILLILAGLSFFITGEDPVHQTTDDNLAVQFFYMPSCPHCNEQKPIYSEIKEERTDIDFREYDASSQKGSRLFYEMARKANMDTSRLGVPTIFVGNQPLVGVHSKEQINTAIDEHVLNSSIGTVPIRTSSGKNNEFVEYKLPFLGKTDLTKWSLPTLAVILGLIDGFNPCALWVLIFLITLLLGEKDKKKIWLVVGSFVIASAISYFLFLTAWLNVFLLIGYVEIITLLIGLFAIGMGVIQLREFFMTKGNLTCKVTNPQSRKKTMDKIKNLVSQPITISVIIGVITLAFTVNAIEFVCSAAIPAVFTQILTLSGISTFQHYLYIGLYVLFYMIDHIILFSMAALALSSNFGQKYAKICTLLGGFIMLILGLIMVYAPHLLR